MTLTRWLAAGLMALGTSPKVAAQNRETLETRVTGVRSVVTLEWSDKHQWDQLLQGAPPVLFAEYRNRDGRVVVDCLFQDLRTARGSGCTGVLPRGDAARRSVRYDLPAQLSGSPAGNVCLLFRLRDGRTLPIRRAGDDKRETGRFRFAAWDALARQQSTVASASVAIDILRDSITRLDAEIQAQLERNKRYGGQSKAECEAMPAPVFEGSGGTPRPEAPASDRERLARQVCVMRVWMADSLATSRSARLNASGVQPPALIDELLRQLSPSFRRVVEETRGEQLATFRRDWASLAQSVPAYRRQRAAKGEAPHFGRMIDVIRQQSLVRLAGRVVEASLTGGKQPDSTFVAGYIGGSLEAYTVCVEDGIQQMEVAFEASRQRTATEASLRTRVRSELILRCTSGVERLERLRAVRADVERRLNAAVAERDQLTTSAPGGDGRARELNGEMCTP